MKSSMSVRFELFVRDMDAAIDFYTGVLDFDLVREDPAYSSLRRGGVILVLAPVSKLPDSGGYFTRDIAGLRRGLGVEIVLETDGLDAAHARILASGHPVSGPLRERSWGLKDFRVVDPDGFRGLRLAYGPFPMYIPAHVQATTPSPGLHPGGSSQSHAAASRAVLFSPSFISMFQVKICPFSQLRAPLP